ncbi:S8 family serine peptidase [Rhodovulum sp. DZ06]|uniref:S8 family serine peptidase n=1 Tax=Rhodovulum sp. DZ06 TaxID=3425126 RepID=UPI003D351C04
MTTDPIELKFGGARLSLSKSDDLVGLRPRSGAARSFEDAMDFEAARGAARREGALGGFEVVRLSDAGAEDWLDRRRERPEIGLGTHVWHVGADPTPLVPTGEIYLEFKAGVPDAARSALLAELGLGVLEARGADGLLATATSASRNPVEVSRRLLSDPRVAAAEPDLGVPLETCGAGAPAQDDLAPLQWHLRNEGTHDGTSVGYVKGADARVADAWALLPETGLPQVRVAIIDDGFDLSHPDLWGQADATLDAETGGPVGRPRPGRRHGTAVAGVALARRSGGRVVGAAPDSRLVAVAMERSITDAGFERWFDFAVQSGAAVISNSWGARARNFPLSTRKARMIERAARDGRDGKGCVVLFAAGNEARDVNDPAAGSVNGFAIHPDVIAVAATTSRDAQAHYSNKGAEIWIAAPSSGAGGWGVVTTDMTGWEVTSAGSVRPAGYARGDYTVESADRFGGTSSACPLVAGVCALVLAANPSLSAAEVKRILADTARTLPDQYAVPDPRYGHGCVNARAAVAAALAAPGAIPGAAAPAAPGGGPAVAAGPAPCTRPARTV